MKNIKFGKLPLKIEKFACFIWLKIVSPKKIAFWFYHIYADNLKMDWHGVEAYSESR